MKSLTRAVLVVAALMTLSVASAEACGRRGGGLFGNRSKCGQSSCGQATVVRVQSAPLQVIPTPIPLPVKPGDGTKPTPLPLPKKTSATSEDLSVETITAQPIAVQSSTVITATTTVGCSGPNCGTTTRIRLFRR